MDWTDERVEHVLQRMTPRITRLRDASAGTISREITELQRSFLDALDQALAEFKTTPLYFRFEGDVDPDYVYIVIAPKARKKRMRRDVV